MKGSSSEASCSELALIALVDVPPPPPFLLMHEPVGAHPDYFRTAVISFYIFHCPSGFGFARGAGSDPR